MLIYERAPWRTFAAALAPLVGLTASLSGQQLPGATAGTTASRDTAKLGTVTVTATRGSEARLTVLQSLTLPAIATVTAKQIDQTVNVVDPEDAVKYLP